MQESFTEQLYIVPAASVSLLGLKSRLKLHEHKSARLITTTEGGRKLPLPSIPEIFWI
jgi:hypothetical protein